MAYGDAIVGAEDPFAHALPCVAFCYCYRQFKCLLEYIKATSLTEDIKILFELTTSTQSPRQRRTLAGHLFASYKRTHKDLPDEGRFPAPFKNLQRSLTLPFYPVQERKMERMIKHFRKKVAKIVGHAPAFAEALLGHLVIVASQDVGEATDIFVPPSEVDSAVGSRERCYKNLQICGLLPDVLTDLVERFVLD